MAKKYYVVWSGKNPGIYDSWAACQAQIKGQKGARFKSFKSLTEAQAAWAGEQVEAPSAQSHIVLPSWSVDAACSGNPGRMEYQGVDTQTKQRIFHLGPLEEGTNNIGEFLAIVHALALLQRTQNPLPIYTDSQTAMAWVRNKKAKTQLKPSTRNAYLFELIARAERWLHAHTFDNPILKWNTRSWGEIPADFGRKK